MGTVANVAGFIFGCTDETEIECLTRKLFGLKGSCWDAVARVEPGMPLWLYNFERKILRGTFRAAGAGTFNLNPLALQGNPSTGSSFPAQCSVTWDDLHEPISIKRLQAELPQIFYSHYKFRFALGPHEAQQLLALFSSRPALPMPAALPLANGRQVSQQGRQALPTRRQYLPSPGST
ncbi:hypothetical protein WJX73_009309 [Symbiochloris irregularis]|uniref:DCD domain-containing protein n=1 Tax=Symbiochloris irregularis TaxID=706552 RepID=A0AAW1NE53_9CHLO